MPRLVESKYAGGRNRRDGSHFVLRDALDDGSQLIDIDRLYNMVNKPGFAAFAHVFFHAVSREGNALQAEAVSHLLHQFITAGIGQPDVADDDIKWFIRCHLQGGCDAC